MDLCPVLLKHINSNNIYQTLGPYNSVSGHGDWGLMKNHARAGSNAIIYDQIVLGMAYADVSHQT